ncbi:MAG: hypothetical protein LQ343_006269 [Gyalolechia ehrenbergii]|nr:MAG: hypothetical protein LQ343_006269 [Gyalolechia ehrenbergii]
MLSAVGLFALFVIASYSARKSYIAIVKLRKYEERSEQAAKRFDTAAHELYKTRATQASSAAAITFSLVSSVALFLRTVVSSSVSSTWELILPPLNAITILAAFLHNQHFWKAKPKVPFVAGYNDGIGKSKEIRQLMIPLGLGWAMVGLFWWAGQ